MMIHRQLMLDDIQEVQQLYLTKVGEQELLEEMVVQEIGKMTELEVVSVIDKVVQVENT
jgi:hypothetical protein